MLELIKTRTEERTQNLGLDGIKKDESRQKVKGNNEVTVEENSSSLYEVDPEFEAIVMQAQGFGDLHKEKPSLKTMLGDLEQDLISKALGGVAAASEQIYSGHLVRTPGELEVTTKAGAFQREIGIPPIQFLTYMFIPLSVGMFPHLFQHWLTAKSAKSFRLTVIAHPICIMVV